MKKLPTLTLAFCLVLITAFSGRAAFQEPAAPPADQGSGTAEPDAKKKVATSDPQAVDLIQQARNRLFERRSVQADMFQLVSLGTYRFQSSGKYLSATGLRYRLEYRVELGELEGRFLEVCDGQVLHTRRQISAASLPSGTAAAPEVELTRRDIQKIIREARNIQQTAAGTTPAAEISTAVLTAEIGIGGLPAVLASLERSLIFEPVQKETAADRRYLVIQGTWRENRRDELLTGLGAMANQIGGFLPDQVRVSFSEETLFPEKIVYLKSTTPQGKTYEPMVLIEYRNVVLDQPVLDQQFIYVAPPGLEERDETASYLEALKLSQGEKPGVSAPASPASPEKP